MLLNLELFFVVLIKFNHCNHNNFIIINIDVKLQIQIFHDLYQIDKIKVHIEIFYASKMAQNGTLFETMNMFQKTLDPCGLICTL